MAGATCPVLLDVLRHEQDMQRAGLASLSPGLLPGLFWQPLHCWHGHGSRGARWDGQVHLPMVNYYATIASRICSHFLRFPSLNPEECRHLAIPSSGCPLAGVCGAGARRFAASGTCAVISGVWRTRPERA